MQALRDVTVLDLSRLLPGPFCTLLLADMGADVIKVEDTTGGDYLRWMPPLVDQYSALFHAVNRNKRSIALNLKTGPGRAAFLRLVERVDVVVEGFRPGVLDRLGVGYKALLERNERVILCSVTGYGQDGPYRDRVGHDINYAALAGVLGVTGCAEDELAVPGVQMGDFGAGGLGAAVAILAALHERTRTGRGQHCDVAMLDGLLSWMAPLAASLGDGAPSPRPGTEPLNGRHPCYRLYRCADGYLSVGALEPKFWQAFVEAIGLGHLGPDGLASGQRAKQVVAEVQTRLATRTRAAWEAVLNGHETCCEPVLSLHEVMAHPQVRWRQTGSAGSDPARRALEGVVPFRIGDTGPTARRPAPRYGEHTREILAGVGYDDASIEELVKEGATIDAR